MQSCSKELVSKHSKPKMSRQQMRPADCQWRGVSPSRPWWRPWCDGVCEAVRGVCLELARGAGDGIMSSGASDQ